jgi:hypothetical protein
MSFFIEARPVHSKLHVFLFFWTAGVMLLLPLVDWYILTAVPSSYSLTTSPVVACTAAPAQAPSTQTPSTQTPSDPLTADALEAVQFVSWWLPNAMDCAPETRMKSHEMAGRVYDWSADDAFARMFWTNETFIKACDEYRLAYFELKKVQFHGLLPDGRALVGASGTLCIQGQHSWTNRNVDMVFFVRKKHPGYELCLHQCSVANATSIGLPSFVWFPLKNQEN